MPMAQRKNINGPLSMNGQLHYNNSIDELLDIAVELGEGALTANDALMVTTGDHTGRSPNDKYIVRTAMTENTIWWDNNASMSVESFNLLRNDMDNHIKGRELYIQDLEAGADINYRQNIRVITEFAWHALFIRHLLRIPDNINDFTADYTIINSPSFKANPTRHECQSDTIIAINLDEKLILIGGTEYAGEIKKSVFTILNYLLPEQNVMPMHCSANHALGTPDNSALFFGLSGTGKTTLSADINRMLIGDDEHGWSDDGIFNFEGGCYAKTINLSPDSEPEIYATTRMRGTVIENSVFSDDEIGQPDFKNASLTANMRCAYSLDAIPNTCKTSTAGHPKNIILLTCDAFGVLPPLAKLTPEQAVYHFLNGFTAKVAGTERGVTEPQPTFSTCFGAPFMPRHPKEYGGLFHQKITEHGSQCWLVNTGWTGGPYGKGERMPIHVTRALLNAILEGNIYNSEFRVDDNFNFTIPIYVDGMDKTILNPRDTWCDKDAYDAQAKKLLAMFDENFTQFKH